jgi:hypothetical protein
MLQMLQILFRAFSTVVTVVIAVVASATLGTSSLGKVWAAVLIAFVIGLVEWLLIWTPKHFAAARKLLDPRANMVGVWLQDVRRVFHGPASRFSIFWVDYLESGDYGVVGFAYDSTGVESARWWSEGSPEFSRDGRSITFRWAGTIMGTEGDPHDPERTGITNMDLNKGTGRVEHVGINLSMMVNIQPITQLLLDEIGMANCKPRDIKISSSARDRVALAFARGLSS